jgi:hypothetical protein
MANRKPNIGPHPPRVARSDGESCMSGRMGIVSMVAFDGALE